MPEDPQCCQTTPLLPLIELCSERVLLISKP